MTILNEPGRESESEAEMHEDGKRNLALDGATRPDLAG